MLAFEPEIVVLGLNEGEKPFISTVVPDFKNLNAEEIWET